MELNRIPVEISGPGGGKMIQLEVNVIQMEVKRF